MRSTVVVDEADEWQTWFSNNAKPAPPTDTTVANT
jgi:cytochrome c oxidase subunit 2